MREVLKNGCELIRGQGIEIGLMQTEEPGKREAHLFWMEGQGIMPERDWRWCSRIEAIAQIAIWLENVGMTFQDGAIVPF